MKILLLLVSLVNAKTVTLPTVPANSLKTQLDAIHPVGGVAISCGATLCDVTWDMENQLNDSVSRAQFLILASVRKSYLRSLALNWDNLNTAQKDVLLKALVLRFLEAD